MGFKETREARDYAWSKCREEREPYEGSDDWSVGEASTYRGFFNLGYEAAISKYNAALDVVRNGRAASFASIDAYKNDPIVRALAANYEQWKREIEQRTIAETSEDIADAIRQECADRAVAWYRTGQLIPAHKESFAIKGLRAAILGSEPTQNEEPMFPLQHGLDGGWTIDFDFLMGIQADFQDAEDYGKPSLETIEEILLVLMRRAAEVKRRLEEAGK